MSLIHGWIPIALQLIAVVMVLLAIGRWSRRWLLLWVPLALLVGAGLAAAVYWYVTDQGVADEPAPLALWAWVAASGLAAAVVVLGWRGAPWWRRVAAVLAVPLSVLCSALTLNSWIGYAPTVDAAWARVTGAPGLSDHRASGPNWATIVKVAIPDDASGFAHREELVYLPPAWYASTPPPQLPVVMMIGGEFSQPADWLDAGNAQQTIDAFAAAHGGNAPVLVFPDYDGAFSNDTECVNGPRGNAADHLTKDVVPFMVSHFGVSVDPANWGVVGWSSGGTCALTLSVMHPELFSAFVDIDGGLGPEAGTKRQTVERLFGGDPEAWAAFDPRTVMAEHGQYQGMSGWFSSSADTPGVYRAPTDQPLASQDPGWGANFDDHAAIADEMCRMASGHGIECAVVPNPGKHDFASAATAFAAALPWLAAKLGTPGVPKVAMPGAPPPP